jgi:hypothetical protein
LKVFVCHWAISFWVLMNISSHSHGHSRPKWDWILALTSFHRRIGREVCLGFLSTSIFLVPRLVRHYLNIFGIVENFENVVVAMLKIWKKFSSTLASLFSMVPNLKILLFLLPKVNDKKLIIIMQLATELAQVLQYTHSFDEPLTMFCQLSCRVMEFSLTPNT